MDHEPVVVIPRGSDSGPICSRCAATVERLQARIAWLEQEKRILIEQLARSGHPGAQQDLVLAYAEAGLPGCSHEFD